MPNYNPTPKEEFLGDREAMAAHHTIVENSYLRRSLELALANYTRKQSEMRAPDLGGAASCFLRIQGAHELLEAFYNLAETSAAPVLRDDLNLSTNRSPKKN